FSTRPARLSSSSTAWPRPMPCAALSKNRPITKHYPPSTSNLLAAKRCGSSSAKRPRNCPSGRRRHKPPAKRSPVRRGVFELCRFLRLVGQKPGFLVLIDDGVCAIGQCLETLRNEPLVFE